ncbi:MAG TPA: hypothetical protein VFC00_26330 [Micromonosporaceae bacterium]|nr:hypothetical protein [Micromonosporaceae bacterium]
MIGHFVEALDRFIQVPAEFARYEFGLADGARILAVDENLLSAVTAEGMPYAMDSTEGLLFDHVDLLNLAMFGSRSGQSIPELAMRYFLRFAASAPTTWFGPREWLVRVRAPATDPTARFRMQGPDVTAPGVAVLEPHTPGVEPAGYQIAVRLTGEEAIVRDPVAQAIYQEMLDALGSGAVVYQTVPEMLRMDHRRAWELRMADCVVVARMLAERLTDVGLRARARRGYLLALVGNDHSWCELYEDGAWKPLDVVFAHLASIDAYGAREEFIAVCRGSRFNRLLPCVAPDATTLVYLNDQPAPSWAQVGVSARVWESR